MRRFKLSIQQLANLVNYGWEVYREVGFSLNAEAFREFVTKMTHDELVSWLISLGGLLQTVESIGEAEIELKADGQHPFLAQLGSFRTPTAVAAGVDERLEVNPSEE